MVDQTPTQHAAHASSPETPRTVEDFRAIVDFVRARVSDEYQEAGGLNYYLEQGVSIRPHIPRDYEGFRDTAKEYTDGWLASHGPERGLAVTSALADLADELANQMMLTKSAPAWSWRAGMAWERLTGVARLWREHPDFQAGWETAADLGEG